MTAGPAASSTRAADRLHKTSRLGGELVQSGPMTTNRSNPAATMAPMHDYPGVRLADAYGSAGRVRIGAGGETVAAR